ncbi:hypothetical protein ABC347_10820 [Sphingomonas sp. 1P06PA]|uniref:hypothetical protein n=1 Tax=Sphingomonas sp. 1P06PA TaxID=554121 RepID=UPI0039A6E371
MLFYNSRRTAQYRVDGVAEVTSYGAQDSVLCRVTMRDGEDVIAYRSDVDSWERIGRQVIPAQPGTYVLNVNLDARPVDVFEVPVIGWMIDPNGPPEPITVDGVNDGADTVPHIQMPDGTIALAMDCTYPDRTYFEKEMTAAAERLAQQRADRAAQTDAAQ